MSGDGGFLAVLVLGGGGVAGLSIWGIIALAKRFKAASLRGDSGTQFMIVLCIGALSLLLLAGVASIGCVAMMSHTHF